MALYDDLSDRAALEPLYVQGEKQGEQPSEQDRHASELAERRWRGASAFVEEVLLAGIVR